MMIQKINEKIQGRTLLRDENVWFGDVTGFLLVKLQSKRIIDGINVRGKSKILGYHRYTGKTPEETLDYLSGFCPDEERLKNQFRHRVFIDETGRERHYFDLILPIAVEPIYSGPTLTDYEIDFDRHTTIDCLVEPKFGSF